MTRSTVQIQHINLEYPIWQKFDLTGFCLPYFRVHSVLNSNSLRPGTLGLQWPFTLYCLFLQSRRGHKIVGLQTSCVIKN